MTKEAAAVFAICRHDLKDGRRRRSGHRKLHRTRHGMFGIGPKMLLGRFCPEQAFWNFRPAALLSNVPDRQAVIVIGCSHGCVEALMDLVAAFDPHWPASIFITRHIGRGPSQLPKVLARRSAMPVLHARDGDLIQQGRVYIAPPDFHLCVLATTVSLSHGPRVNWTRPAIDPMFRSAATAHTTSVIGILLSGYLSDGASGLFEVYAKGGQTIVQDPADAIAPYIPLTALQRVNPDHVVTVKKIPAAIGACIANVPRQAKEPISG